ncbi:AraC family transcriptional regulator [Alteromonadaceae bacterium M269]|nr:AraC family transcriptional regulator [Alteromonadaceae bacterium M269]
MDTISDILDTLKFKGCIYFTTDFSAPWGIRVPDFKRVVRFHIVTSGQCWVKIAGHSEGTTLSPGDIIVIPHGAAHTLSDKAESPVLPLDDAIEVSGYQGTGVFKFGGDEQLNNVELICGHFEFDQNFRHALIEQLPDLIVVKNNEAMKYPWLGDSIRSLSYETQVKRIGNDAVIKRLSEIIFIHAIRAWSERTEQTEGFLLAVSDQKLGKSLQAFHADPARRWTLNELAVEAGLSRTVFAQRFKDVAGMPAMQYVTEWRAQQSQKLLLESSRSVEEIAEIVGYDSLAAFSRMFKKLFGIGPGMFRRRGKEDKS